mmetsp:Transcript_11128/g.33064  ORF Transcript_11128/g.33064 Transcript_11128/m.33064 type:complete len:152 (-) Transcript_11128:133-588(-)
METLAQRLTDEEELLRAAAPIVEAVRAREDLKAALRHFSRDATNPLRLFGRQPPGKLLREEKRRNRLTAELARLNRSLAQLLPAFERCHGRPFEWQGTDYLRAMQADILALEREEEVANLVDLGVAVTARPSSSNSKVWQHAGSSTPSLSQ